VGESIRVSPDRLKQGSTKIAALKRDYDDQVNRIMSDVRNMRSSWTGADNDAYAAAVEEFKPDLDALAQKLQQISDFLGGAGKAYADNQQANVSGANRLR